MALMSVDLLRQQSKWKESLAQTRQLMATLVQEGFNSTHMKAWRTHWDYQYYKALEHQYQLGLEALNENLPEIKVELIYRLRVFLVSLLTLLFLFLSPSLPPLSLLSLPPSPLFPDINSYSFVPVWRKSSPNTLEK